MMAQLSSTQFTQWQAYSAIEPFGEYRSELRHGQQMQLLDAAHFKRDHPKKVLDFMNFVDAPPEKKMTDEEIEMAFKGIFGV